MRLRYQKSYSKITCVSQKKASEAVLHVDALAARWMEKGSPVSNRLGSS